MTWHYRGVITDGKDHLNDTTSGNTEENDMAVMADNKTVMVVMRTDVRAHCLSLSRHTAEPTRPGRGDCTCGMAKLPYTHFDPCGVYVRQPYLLICRALRLADPNSITCSGLTISRTQAM